MTNLQRRLRKLEARRKPRGKPRVVVRYEGCDGRDPNLEPGPEEDFDKNDPNVILVKVEYFDMPPKSGLGQSRGSRTATDIDS